jgi:hypothetical protein
MGPILPITSVGDALLLGPFYLNNVLVIPDIMKNLLSVRQFNIDNLCSIEFDPFGFSVKDLATRNVITRCNSSRLLYTIHLLVTRTPERLHTMLLLLLPPLCLSVTVVWVTPAPILCRSFLVLAPLLVINPKIFLSTS